MPIEIKTALIGVIAALLGGWVGAAISRKSANDIIRKQEFNKAASSIRAAFAPALSFIYLAKNHGSTHEAPDVDKFLRDNLMTQASVVEEFRYFVPNNNRITYQKAWEDYRHEVWNYGFDASSITPNIDAHNVYTEKINNILKYAEVN